VGMAEGLNLPDDIVRGRRVRNRIEDNQAVWLNRSQMMWLSFFLGSLLKTYADKGDSPEHLEATHHAIVDLFRVIMGDGTIQLEMTEEDHKRLGVIDMEISSDSPEDGLAYAHAIFEHCEQYWPAGGPKKARIVSFVLPLE
jgi:hypothetical protein